jgi:hypothetical protein
MVKQADQLICSGVLREIVLQINKSFILEDGQLMGGWVLVQEGWAVDKGVLMQAGLFAYCIL